MCIHSFDSNECLAVTCLEISEENQLFELIIFHTYTHIFFCEAGKSVVFVQFVIVQLNPHPQLSEKCGEQ